MVNLFRHMLELALFPRDAGGVVYIPAGEASGPSKFEQTGEFNLPSEMFPPHCRVQTLPADETALLALDETLREPPARLFMIPPFLPARALSALARGSYPRLDLPMILLRKLADRLPPTTRFGIFLPASDLVLDSSQDFRSSLFRQVSSVLIIFHDYSLQALGLPVHGLFRAVTLIVDNHAAENAPMRFFRCPEAETEADQTEVIADLQQLLRQGGGQTKFGYVLRDLPAHGAALAYDLYHPDLFRKQQELAAFGGVSRLGDVMLIRRGLNLNANASILLPGDGGMGVPIIEARDIRPDGELNYADARYRAQVEPEWQLQPGDICLRALHGSSDHLGVVCVESYMLPLAAAHTVIVLRPLAGAAELTGRTALLDAQILLAYLRSTVFAEFLRANRSGVNVNLRALQDMPIPVIDEAMTVAVRSLDEAAASFLHWSEEANEARGSLFEFAAATDARLHILSAGRRARQRRDAAGLVDDFHQRIRTQYPHPIAFRWRTIETSDPGLEGYVHILECAELTAAYLAAMAIVLSRQCGVVIGYLTPMADKLAGGTQGTTMGEWVTILNEVRQSKKFSRLSSVVSFYEVLRFLDEPELLAAIDKLKAWRDDQAHGRGPKAEEVVPYFGAARTELERFLRGVEFLTEYRLRYIETTARDSLAGVTHYTYRDLMGDHPLVPIEAAKYHDGDLEAGSLYLVDRAGALHLARPMLTRRQCHKCWSWATYYLDGYQPEGDVSKLRSMEHGHAGHYEQDPNTTAAFRQVGLLPNTN
jgi:hypothetical protein